MSPAMRAGSSDLSLWVQVCAPEVHQQIPWGKNPRRLGLPERRCHPRTLSSQAYQRWARKYFRFLMPSEELFLEPPAAAPPISPFRDSLAHSGWQQMWGSPPSQSLVPSPHLSKRPSLCQPPCQPQGRGGEPWGTLTLPPDSHVRPPLWRGMACDCVWISGHVSTSDVEHPGSGPTRGGCLLLRSGWRTAIGGPVISFC